MERWIVYSPDEISECSNQAEAKSLAKDLDDVNCHFYAVRIFNEEELKEFVWEWFSKAYPVSGQKIAKEIFEREWKERE